MDAKNDESESQEQSESLELELPASLAEALMHLAYTQAQTNQLLQRLLIELLADHEDADIPHEDMEGRPIRDS